MTKQIILKKSVVAVALTLASSHVVLAQESANAAPIQRVVVTGSNIKQIDQETAAPVQIIKREEILRLGVNSVKDVLDTLTSSARDSLSDSNGSSSFAGGASSADLRNLGKQSTLVLLNSRRVAPYALADYNEVFTNLDSLPLDAIERIEVLRSGGSAIYGSDAVAGVINIITRSDYRGVTVKASRDQSMKNSAFKTQTASITAGFGDLNTDRYNVLANVEVFQRKSVMWRQVVDDINPGYGLKFGAVAKGSGQMFGERGAPSTYSYPGNIMGQGPVPGCTTLNPGGLCVFDRFSRFEAAPASDRVNLLVSGRLNISQDLQGFSEVLFAKTKSTYKNAFATYDSTAGDTVWGDPRNNSTRSYVSRYLPATHPLNQTGEEAPLRYRFADAPSERTVDSSQYRVMGGLKGSWDKYDWETAVGVMGSKSKDVKRGTLSLSGFQQLIGATDATTDDPLFFNRGYQIGGKNSAATLNTLFPSFGTDGEIRQYFVDAKVSGELTTFQGRPVGVALGGDVRRETFKITPSERLLAADIIGFGSAGADAARNTASIFSEINFPLTSSVEVIGALRADKFPGFDTHLSPKLALRYEASKQLLFRATFESGFRAPNLTESALSTKSAYDNGTSDPKRCPQAQKLSDALIAAADLLPNSDVNKGVLLARADKVNSDECAGGVASVVRNNPNLKPETSRSATIGFVIEPIKDFSLSLDYWHIERRNEIENRATDELLAEEDSLAPGVVVRSPLSADKTFTAAERAQYGVSAGPLSNTSGTFENLSKTKVSGIDLGAAGRVNTDLGKLNLSANATYLLELREYASSLGRYGDNLAGRYEHSKVVANVGASLQTGSFTNGLRLVYNSPYELQGDYFDAKAYGPQGCEDKGWSKRECTVAASMRLDYSFSYIGIKNLTLSAFVRNVLDRRPPLDLKDFSRDGGGVIPQNSSDVQGRSVRLTAEYKFF